MRKYNKLQTILQANSLFTMYAMSGFHCTMTIGTNDCSHYVDVTVFWDDDEQLNFIRCGSVGLLRDGDGYQCQQHPDNGFPGGWVEFIFYFE